MEAANGPRPGLHLDLRQAIHGIVAHYAWQPTLNGMPHAVASLFDNFFPLASYRTSDGRTVMASGVYPQMAASWLRFLGTPPEWKASSPRSRLGLGRARGSRERPRAGAHDRSHPAGVVVPPPRRAAARTPVVEIEKVADGKPRPFGAGAQPLSGIRALSFTHAVAGPTVVP